MLSKQSKRRRTKQEIEQAIATEEMNQMLSQDLDREVMILKAELAKKDIEASQNDKASAILNGFIRNKKCEIDGYGKVHVLPNLIGNQEMME